MCACAHVCACINHGCVYGPWVLCQTCNTRRMEYRSERETAAATTTTKLSRINNINSRQWKKARAKTKHTLKLYLKTHSSQPLILIYIRSTQQVRRDRCCLRALCVSANRLAGVCSHFENRHFDFKTRRSFFWLLLLLLLRQQFTFTRESI